MQFKNRIRLPIHISKPQFPATRTVFSFADGSSKTLSARIRNTYEGSTDWMDAAMHRNLQVALNHDSVTIEGTRYIGGVTPEGDYEILWNEFLDYPIAPAKFKVQATPFDFSNQNCKTCEEVTQLQLEDDYLTTVYESLDEGDTSSMNVLENDSICCSPILASIVWINPDFVDSATIDPNTGILEVELLPSTSSGTNVKLATYRITCPNGGYDEADVYANVAGTVVGCEPPGSLDPGTITETEATPNWFDVPPGSASFEYKLYDTTNLGTPIDEGTTTEHSVHYDNLEPGHCYLFTLRTICGYGDSEWISVEFCTPISSSNCGRYSVFKYDPTAPPGAGPYSYQYINCAGAYVDSFIMNYQTLLICMLESAPGVPIFIENITTYTYVEPC